MVCFAAFLMDEKDEIKRTMFVNTVHDISIDMIIAA